MKILLLLSLVVGVSYGQGNARYDAALAKTRSTDAKTRNDGVEALGLLKSPQSVAAVINILSSEKDGRVRQTAATVLGSFADLSVVPSLVTALNDSHPPVRFAAVRSLGSLHAKQGVNALIPLLKDADPAMRRTVAASLGQIIEPSSAAALKDSLTDSDELTRLEAGLALARLGDASGQSAALSSLQSKSDTARRNAATILALSGDSSSGQALDAAVSNEKNKEIKKILDDARIQLRQRHSMKKANK